MDDSLEYDIQNFDDMFLAMEPTVKEDRAAEGDDNADPDVTASSPEPMSPEAFSGYDFKDRDLVSVVIEDEEDEAAQLGRPSIDEVVQHAEIDVKPADGPAELERNAETIAAKA